MDKKENKLVMGKKMVAKVAPLVKQDKALLIGLKHPRMNSDHVKVQILRMKKFLMDLRGFSENNITLLIEDDDDEYTQPTSFNIRAEAHYLAHRTHPGDTLFIHIIAHGCCPGTITSSDKHLVSDAHFRLFIREAVRLGHNLTIVSDCLIEPPAAANANSVCCSLGNPKDLHRAHENEIKGFSARHPDAKFVITGFSFTLPANLSPVDILKVKEEEEEEETTTTKQEEPSYYSSITKILKTIPELFFRKILHFLSGLLNFINLGSPRRKRRRSRCVFRNSSTVVLLNAFQYEQNEAKQDYLFFPPPEDQHGLYGGFTSTILNIIEETQGRVTNVELARMAMERLGMRGGPGLHSNHPHHAYAPFIGGRKEGIE